ncbi:MAG: hypothetical protein Q8O67_20190 [Deltaproteobacteria bacterium]|nr:hypothetical protein [Deltaproteobacteria bacterium]
MNDKVGGADQLDIGMIITAPTKDKDWMKKCAIMGLIMMIPIAGALNMYGWVKTITERRLANGPDVDTLPEAGLHYMAPGWKFFLAMLPLIGGVLLFIFAGSAVAGVAVYMGAKGGGQGAESIVMGIVVLMYVGIIFFALIMQVLSPAIMFLHIVDGEPWASIQFRKMWEVMQLGGVQYLLLFVAVLIAGMIGSLGVMACYVGMFVTIPFGQAMMGIAVAEYAKILRPMKAGFHVDGGTGGASGQPFGVSKS